MNRNNPQSLIHRAKATAMNIGGKVAAGTALVGAGISTALAQSSLGTAAAAAVGDVQDDVNGVLVVLVLVVFALVAWGYLKRAK